MLVNGTKLKIEKWIAKHPSNPIKIGDTMKSGKAGNQHSYFVAKDKGKSKDFAKGKGKVSNK